MKNNTVPLDTSVGSNQTANRQLQGKWLLIAKGVYIVSLTMVFLVQVFIIANYFQKTQELLRTYPEIRARTISAQAMKMKASQF